MNRIVEGKKSKGIFLLVLISILDIFMIRMFPSGFNRISYWFMLLIFVGITIYALLRYKAIAYQKNNCFHAVHLNNTMNGAPTLKIYFENRDELIQLLQVFAKQEVLVGKNNYLTEKPSKLLKEINQNENLSVHSAIIREFEYLKKRVKEERFLQSHIFSEHIDLYRCRMSDDNKNSALAWLKILQDYESIAGKIEEADNMDGHTFEYWCADLLRKNGFSNVEVTQGSGDQGVDIIAMKDGIRYAIQCKCYSSDLGNTPVQEVHTGKAIYHCQVGAVMTNRYFTAGAKQAAEATGTLLWDRDKLKEMLDNAGE